MLAAQRRAFRLYISTCTRPASRCPHLHVLLEACQVAGEERAVDLHEAVLAGERDRQRHEQALQPRVDDKGAWRRGAGEGARQWSTRLFAFGLGKQPVLRAPQHLVNHRPHLLWGSSLRHTGCCECSSASAWRGQTCIRQGWGGFGMSQGREWADVQAVQRRTPHHPSQPHPSPMAPAQVLADQRDGHRRLVGVQLGHVEVVHKVDQLLGARGAVVDARLLLKRAFQNLGPWGECTRVRSS